MSRLERELRELGGALAWPETPDLAARVTAGLAAPPPRRPGRRRRVALAVALVIAASLAVLAVPPARTAVLDWLGIGGARVSIVDELPPVRTVPGLEILGDPVSLAEARGRAGFPFADPPEDEPEPDQIRAVPGGRVSYVWREGERLRLLVTQFPGSVGDPTLVKKLVGSGTSTQQFLLDGDEALWLEGGPHVVLFVAPDGSVRDDRGWLAGNTLLVDRDGVTVRVEGALTRREAVALVRAMSS